MRVRKISFTGSCGTGKKIPGDICKVEFEAGDLGARLAFF
jgi:hypothetical protein